MNEIQRTAEGSWMLADTAVGLVGAANKECTILQKIHWKAAEKGPKLSLPGIVRESADGGCQDRIFT